MVVPQFCALSQALYIIEENCNSIVEERKQEFPSSSLLAIVVTGLQTDELSRKGSLLFIIPYITL